MEISLMDRRGWKLGTSVPALMQRCAGPVATHITTRRWPCEVTAGHVAFRKGRPVGCARRPLASAVRHHTPQSSSARCQRGMLIIITGYADELASQQAPINSVGGDGLKMHRAFIEYLSPPICCGSQGTIGLLCKLRRACNCAS